MTRLTDLTFSAGGPRISRRGLILSAGAAGLALASGARRASRRRRQCAQGRLHQPAHRRARRLRPDRRLCARRRAQGARQRASTVGDKTYRGQDPRSGHAVRSLARRPARQDADQQRPGRSDAARSRRPRRSIPVADACEAAGVPCLSTVMPWEAWYFGRGAKPGAPSPFKWTYHFGFGGEEFYKTYVSQWNLHRDQQEGRRALSQRRRRQRHPRSISRRRSPRPASPSSTPARMRTARPIIPRRSRKFKKEKCEIFNTFPIPPDFAAFWRQAAQQGYTKMVKICQIAKTGLFPDGVEALGDLGYNISQRRLLAQGVPLQVVADRRLRRRTRRRLREGVRQAMDAAARRHRWRCSTPASPR